MDLRQYKLELQEELDNILNYWKEYTVDETNGGFYGRIDNNNHLFKEAPKGSVLNARILWTFSAAYNANKDPAWLNIADRAFAYISNYFEDRKHGGIYWSVDYTGRPLDTKKQIYALAFVCYACSEYYRCNHDEPAKELAIRMYTLIRKYSFDEWKGGYLEAFTEDWRLLSDQRLSNKDANEKKTTNTHLHVLEAYANLYRIWPDPELAVHISLLLGNFDDYIINKKTWHLDMFFDEHWNVKTDIISFGHDIEASWLLLETAVISGQDNWIEKMKTIAIKMADAVTEGLDEDGGLWYESEPSAHGLIKEKHWWPQAEAQVGFFNAWQVSGDDKYLQYVFRNWAFIKKHLLNKEKGEWFWGVREDYSIMPGEDKVGIWKCPYHNGRACLEIIHR